MNNDNNANLIHEEVPAEYVKCSSCGANMVFEPSQQVLSCPHCGSIKRFDTSSTAQEQDILKGFSDNQTWKEHEACVYKCQNCGAKVVLKSGETANSCPFCGTAHVQVVEELAGIKPNALLPFTFNCEKALSISKEWAKRKAFAPNDFKKNLKAENLNGVYAPCFTFDSWTTSTYVGRIGKTYTKRVGSGKNARVVSYTVWRDIAGTHYDSFDDLLENSGSKIDQKTLTKISPFETNQAKVFDEQYMLGFMAYHYDRNIEDCWDSAKAKIDVVLKRTILSKYVYDKIAYFNVSTNHERVTYKYVMLPIYVGNFLYAKKSYNFYINGSTGKIFGKTPKSFWKIFITVATSVLTCVAVGLICYFLSS